MKATEIQHLYNRIGFGIQPKHVAQLVGKSRTAIVESLFSESQKNTDLEIDISFYNQYSKEDFKDKTIRREIRKKSRAKIVAYNLAWFNRLSKPTELLREKMTLFWANHFVCEDKSIRYVQLFNNCLRENALGNFGDFAKQISKQPAMLNYLNNKQNKKKSPNENFSRELMELFTLGGKIYTQKDVSESARAFTGYTNNRFGEFKIRKKHHDDNEKTFLGEQGNFDGDDIINIILKQKQCATFICEKVYRYFVNDTINQDNLDKMVAVFYQNYDIKALMHFMLLSDWFYDDENIGTKIKSPIEFLVGMNTVVPYEILEAKRGIRVQKQLGQILLNPPNVAGWKTGKFWIDSNTIITRLRIPSLILNNREISFSSYNDDEAMMKTYGKKKKKYKQYVKATIDWKQFYANYENTENSEMVTQILSPKINSGTKKMLSQKQNVSKQAFCIQLMSLPEYQLC